MPLFILCFGYKDGSQKTPELLRATHGKNWRLPRPDWFQQLLEQQGGAELLKPLVRNEKRFCDTRDRFDDLLLLRVAPGLGYTGSLTPWSKESWFWFHYYFQPMDAFSLQVEGRVKVDLAGVLEDPEIGRSVRKKSLLFCLGQRLLVLPETRFRRCGFNLQNASMSRAQALHEMGITGSHADQWDLNAGNLCCMWVPEPVLHLLKSNSWKTVMMQARWLQGWRNISLRETLNRGMSPFPDAVWMQNLMTRDLLYAHVPIDSGPSNLSPGAAARVAALLRNYTPQLLHEIPEDGKEEAEMSLASVVNHLAAQRSAHVCHEDTDPRANQSSPEHPCCSGYP